MQTAQARMWTKAYKFVVWYAIHFTIEALFLWDSLESIYALPYTDSGPKYKPRELQGRIEILTSSTAIEE